MTRLPPPPVPLTIVTGPLGAGKSRLINALTAPDTFAGALAIAGEAGRTPLLRQPAIALPKAGDGCLCCSGGGELSLLLETLLRAVDNARMEPFTRLFLETDGAADPMRPAAEIHRHPYLSKRFGLTGIIALRANSAGEHDPAWTSQRQAAAAVIDDAAKGDITATVLAAARLAAETPFSAAGLPADVRQRLYLLSPAGRR